MRPPVPQYTRDDLDHSPMVVFYETTRACDLACQHCRADAQRSCDPGELSSPDALRLVKQLTEFPKPPLLVLTGGDPLKRPDVFEIIRAAVAAGLKVALTPSATPLATDDAIRQLKSMGLHRLAVSLDAADAATHDGFRGVPGSFTRTLEIVRAARACDLPVQINTTITRHNQSQVSVIADLLATLDIVLWSVFFLVPTGRGLVSQRLEANEMERVFGELWEQSRKQPYALKTTEAPHYRRFVMQQARNSGEARPAASPLPPAIGTNDGKGVMFISHTGEIYPSGFLPVECGRFPFESVVKVYQDAALFRALRAPDDFRGKCGACEFRNICGGSRARAYAMTGDPLQSEPDCSYIPAKHAAAAAC
jgi:AdoMet-dependent heme synthase